MNIIKFCTMSFFSLCFVAMGRQNAHAQTSSTLFTGLSEQQINDVAQRAMQEFDVPGLAR